MSEWIRVTESLPAMGEDVLIVDRDGFCPAVGCLTEDGWEIDGIHFYVTEDHSQFPVYWMPLPETPNE